MSGNISRIKFPLGKQAQQPTPTISGQFLVRLFDTTFQKMPPTHWHSPPLSARRGFAGCAGCQQADHRVDMTDVSLKIIQHKNMQLCTETSGLSDNLCPRVPLILLLFFFFCSSLFLLMDPVVLSLNFLVILIWKCQHCGGSSDSIHDLLSETWVHIKKLNLEHD